MEKQYKGPKGLESKKRDFGRLRGTLRKLSSCLRDRATYADMHMWLGSRAPAISSDTGWGKKHGSNGCNRQPGSVLLGSGHRRTSALLCMHCGRLLNHSWLMCLLYGSLWNFLLECGLHVFLDILVPLNSQQPDLQVVYFLPSAFSIQKGKWGVWILTGSEYMDT